MATPRPPERTEPVRARHLTTVRTDCIAPCSVPQVRRQFDPGRIATLAESVRRSGVRQPIIVAPDRSRPDRYCLVAGERRWRAARLAGLAEIPCLVDEALADPRQRLLAQAEENLHREDLNAVEEAAVLVQLMEAFGGRAEEAGALIGRSYQQARRLIQIHEAPQPIRDAVLQGHIDARAALELVRIHNKLAHDAAPGGKQQAAVELDELIDRVVNERWSIRRLEAYARKLTSGCQPPGPAPRQAAAAQEQVRSGQAAAVAPRLTTAPATEPVGPPYRRDAKGVFIDTGRISRRQVSPEEREELIKILEELLMAVRRV
jgi:ParB family transcriptional regulator, chromosome partitioning protein